MSNSAEVSGIPRSEFGERRAELRRRAAERGLDGILVVSRGANSGDWGADVLYLTNHHSAFPQIPDRPPAWTGRGFAGVVMPVDSDATLVVDIPDWRDDLVVCDDVRTSLNLWAGLAETLKDRGLAEGKVGLIGRESFLEVTGETIRDSLPGLELVWADDLIEDMRVRKSEAELALVRNSVRVGSEMVAALLEAAVPGATEADCVLAALNTGLPQGAFPLDIPVTSGEFVDHFQWDRMPSWNHERKLVEGDMLHPDMYGSVNGYYYDMVRTTVVGRKATPEQKEVLEGAVAVIEHVVEAIKPGVTCEELYRRGVTWLADNGFDAPGETSDTSGPFAESFPSFGHSMGLTWEHPWLMPGESTALEPNMVLAVEVEVHKPGCGTGAFEHNVIVTDDGVEVLTRDLESVWWE